MDIGQSSGAETFLLYESYTPEGESMKPAAGQRSPCPRSWRDSPMTFSSPGVTNSRSCPPPPGAVPQAFREAKASVERKASNAKKATQRLRRTESAPIPPTTGKGLALATPPQGA
jgi:hypothetical protein